MERLHLPVLMMIGAMTLACGAGESDAGLDGQAAETEPSVVEEATGEEAFDQKLEAGLDGTITFTVNGTEKTFDHFPASENSYTKMTTQLVAHPDEGATQRIFIRINNADVAAQSYPAKIPPPEDEGTPDSVKHALTRPMVVYAYTNEEGKTAKGIEPITIDSFSGGRVIEGSFGQIPLPNTDDDLRGYEISNGEFRVDLPD